MEKLNYAVLSGTDYLHRTVVGDEVRFLIDNCDTLTGKDRELHEKVKADVVRRIGKGPYTVVDIGKHTPPDPVLEIRGCGGSIDVNYCFLEPTDKKTATWERLWARTAGRYAQ